MSDTPGAAGGPALSREQVHHLVAIAARAPSVHNTQPWWFHPGPAGLELHADRSRQLTAVDPDGRPVRAAPGRPAARLPAGGRGAARPQAA